MEIAVRKATRLDYNPPKQKHLSALVSLTFHNPAIIGEMLELLERRHRENSWIMSFKVLVIMHVLMRQGNGDRTISYVESHPACLDTTRLREKSSGVIHIQNIYLYTAYLQEKVAAYRELHIDYIKTTMTTKVGRLRRLSIKDGLLKETLVLQKQVSTLLKCKFILEDVDNTISLFAFRLVVEDLLILFQAVNEGVVNILEHYFAMPKSDARISLEIYKRFAKQTEEVTHFLDRARQFQQEMYIAIPVTKHAPLSLATALEEYLTELKDQPSPQQGNNHGNGPSQTTPTTTNSTPRRPEPEQPKALLDFFSSLENDQAFSPVPTPQPSLHNPFRSNTAPTSTSNNSIMSDLSLLAPPGPQPQQSMPLLSMQQQQAPQLFSAAPPSLISSTTSSPLPSNANPFRTANDLSPLQTLQQQPSQQQLTLFQSPGGLLQQQPQTSMPTGNINDFVSAAPNPFMQQQQQQQQQQQAAFQTPQLTGMPNGLNPFGMPLSSPQQQQHHHQQQQAWGPSSVF